MRKNVLNLLVGVVVFVTAFVHVQPAEADILITPTRVIFEDRDRFASVMLVNNGGKTRTYNLEWSFFKMMEDDGTYETTEAPPSDFDPSQHIVFSPRRITLAPGASQKIRLALRRPESIPPGDYHVHLKFYLDPDAPEEIIESHKNDLDDGDSRAGAAIVINVSYSVPVFIIAGKPDVQATIGALSMKRNEQNGKLHAVFPVERSGGAYSIMGHVYVYHQDGSGNETLVGEVSNGHIFPEVTRRIFDVPLNREISGGSLRVVVKHFDNEENLVYAERSFPLQ